MRKKIFALLMVICLIFAMATGCSGASDKETDSGGGKTETETEAPADDDKSSETEAVEETEETNDVSNKEEDAVEETPDVILTGDTEITDQDIQEIYASIKESITTEYLEPNGLSESKFSWPASDSESWKYVDDLYTSCYLCIDLNIPFTEEETAKYDGKYPENDMQLFDAVFSGILKWMDSKGQYDSAYFSKVMGVLNPYSSVLPTITF